MKLKAFLIAMIINAVLMVAISIILNNGLSLPAFFAIPALSILLSTIEIYRANKGGRENTKGLYFLWGSLASLPFVFIVGIIALMISGPIC